MVMLGVNLNRLHTTKDQIDIEREIREGFRTVHREHCNHDIDHNFEFCLICGGTVNEDVCCIKADFSELTVDDWRKTENVTIRIEKDGIPRSIPNNMQVLPNMFVILSLACIVDKITS